MKTKSTRSALISAILVLVMSLAMLAGTTYAWFTDSASSTGNTITAGKLDVELHMFNENSGAYENITDSNLPIFGENGLVDINEDVDLLWEPGKTQVVYLAIKNAGNLALKYRVSLDVTDIKKDLNEVLSYTITPDAKAPEGKLTAWDGTNAKRVIEGVQLVSAESTAMKAGDIHYFALSVHMDEDAGSKYMEGSISFNIDVIAGQLGNHAFAEKDSFGNGYDKDAIFPEINTENLKGGEAITAGNVKIEAPAELGAGEYTLSVDNYEVTEDPATGDTTVSFDIDFSKDGEKMDTAIPGVKFPVSIYVGENLNIDSVTHKGEAIEEFEYNRTTGIVSFETDCFSPFEIIYYAGVVDADAPAEDVLALIGRGGEFDINSDITVTETLVVAEGESLTLNLNGHTISGSMHKNDGAIIKNMGSLVLRNGTVSSLGANGGSALANGGVAVCEDVTLNGAYNADGSWPSYTVNNTGVLTLNDCDLTSVHGCVASYGAGALVTLNDSNIAMSGIKGFTSHGIYTYSDGKVVVNGGNIANNADDQAATGASVINGAVTINSGNFVGYIQNYYGTPVINDGTFSVKPNASFIKAGYEAAKNGDVYYIVPKGFTPVSTADELVEALENDKNVFFLNDIKIDPANMSNAYGATGINVKLGQTIDGNDFTLDIKGAGGTWDSGISTTGGIIKNIKITGSFRGVFINHNSDYSETVVLENVIIEGTTYTISCDQGKNQNFVANNSTFNGWTSYADTVGTATFNGCSFGEGNGYAFLRPYAPTTFVGCDFEAGYTVDPRAAVTFENCTLDGVLITAENVSELVTSTANVTVK